MTFHIGTLVHSGKEENVCLFSFKSFVLRRQPPLLVRFNEEESGFLTNLVHSSTNASVINRNRALTLERGVNQKDENSLVEINDLFYVLSSSHP